MPVSEEEVTAAFKAHCGAEYGMPCDYPHCDCDYNGSPFEDGFRYMRAALEAAAIVREEASIYLETDGGWYAISLGKPKYCLFAATLDGVKEREQKAREFYNANQ